MRLNLINISGRMRVYGYMKKPQFTADGFYHIYNRGVEKRKVFMDKDDYFRFVHDLFEFNDKASANNLYYYRLPFLKSYEVRPHKIWRGKREVLVEIIAYCLMPNHFHLFLREKVDGGIVAFMQKLGTGYTMYFNQKYRRVGGLFQGTFRAALVEQQAHFLYLPHYIHLNPLDLTSYSWRHKGIAGAKQALKFLESYRWSSYPDHIGKKNFPSVISRNLFKKLFGTPREYRQSLREWIGAMDLNDLAQITLEDVH